MEEVVKFLLGILSIFIMGFLFSAYEYMARMKYIKSKINTKYGKNFDPDDVFYKMASVSSYFENQKIENCIDDITWNDLSMDDVYKEINNAQSSAGRDLLYTILRNPLYNEKELLKRDNIIEYFRQNEKERKEIQYILGKLGESRDLYPTNCLFNPIDKSKSKLLKYRILSELPFIFLLLSIFNMYFLILLVISIGVNIWISNADKKYNYNIDGFTYIISLINIAKKIKLLNREVLNNNLNDISINLDNVKHIRKKSIGGSKSMIGSEINVFSEYINMISLTELKNYEKVKLTVIQKSEDLKAIYDYIGTIDALIGVASFRDSLDYYTKPNLSISNFKNENKLNVTDIYHPLIENPIPNSGDFNKCVLLTGSNASGKSTFIKILAINAILAQTIYTVCAKEYDSSYFNIYTSMALKDDIFSNESYYIVEIKSLKRIIDNSSKDIPCLCFVDEILRGTNTIERIASSCEVLSYLEKSNAICFAATHDIELTHLLETTFDNYHFEENITDNDIKFDYKLRKGRSQSRNAIKLLSFMRYNKEIVDRANERAEKFILNGSWEI